MVLEGEKRDFAKKVDELRRGNPILSRKEVKALKKALDSSSELNKEMKHTSKIALVGWLNTLS